MIRPVLLLCTIGSLPLLAQPLLSQDERTTRLIARLSEEAAAFRRVAPQVLGQETLQQRALKPPRRFRVRMGNSADAVEWQERRIVSEYGFTVLGDGAVHELRQVQSVDGRDTKPSGKELSAIASSNDEKRKRDLLEDFEKHGLLGAVTDFGQLILLFTPGAVGQYGIDFVREDFLDGAGVLVFRYEQRQGRNMLTIVDGRKNETRTVGVQGEIWVRDDNFMPVRITLEATYTLGEGGIREEAEVNYQMSSYGAVMPVSVRHRDMRGVNIIAENTFIYSGFRKFGASSDIKFEPGDSQQ